MQKSVISTCDIAAGSTIRIEDLSCKRPATVYRHLARKTDRKKDPKAVKVILDYIRNDRLDLNMQNIVVIGANLHAKVVIDIIESEGKYKIAGLLDPYKQRMKPFAVTQFLAGRRFTQINRSLFTRWLHYCDCWEFQAFESCKKIMKITSYLKPVSIIHPTATLASGVPVNEGTVIVPGAIINSSATVGRFCILNTKSSLDHDSVLKDFASLAPNATIGGSCTIGECSAICIGATLTHDIKIGEHSVIGAGSVVLKNIAPTVVAYGTPAEIIRRRKTKDSYL